MTRTLIGPLQQLGLIVRDVDQAIDHCVNVLGVGPFVVLPEQQFADYSYRGTPMTGPVCTLAFAQTETVQIELIKQHDDVPSAYKEFYDAGGDGLQHVCVWPDTREEFEAWRQDLLDRGLTVVHEGQVDGSPLRFTYMEKPGAGWYPMIEISEGNFPLLEQVWAKLRAANANWDGERRTVPVEEIFA